MQKNRYVLLRDGSFYGTGPKEYMAELLVDYCLKLESIYKDSRHKFEIITMEEYRLIKNKKDAH